MLEQTKYEKMWEHDAYRVVAPGAFAVNKFLEVANPRKGETIRDMGCGTGRAGLSLADAGLEVTQYDFAANCRDPEVTLPFVQHDLTKPIPGDPTDYGYCTDVLEHIPPEDVPAVLRHVCTAARRVFLQIACTPDHMGQLIGESLHLTVQQYAWWKEQLEAFECRIIWSEDKGHECSFYVSAFADARDYSPKSVLNVSHDTIRENIRANLAYDYAEVAPHAATDRPIMVLAGGPTLSDFEDEIIARRKAGELLVTVNGTYNWCLERGIHPSLQIVCDAREFNNRFVKPAIPKCRYLIASQCHPSVAASLPHDQVLMWHSGDHLRETLAEWDKEHNRERAWYPVQGGGTVILRGLPLLMMLGFRKFELFGFDCCLRDSKHHAYSQPENDRTLEIPVRVGGREFKCHPWMVAQAGDWMRLLQYIGPHIDLEVRGDSLISHIIATAAEER